MEVHHARAMEVREALEAANRAFESELRKVGDEQWGLPTPCGEWDVRALVNHVLLGTRMSIQILDGMPRAEIIAGLNDEMLGASTDPVADFNRLAAQMCQGFAGPDGLEGMVVHPAGDFPRAMFAGSPMAQLTPGILGLRWVLSQHSMGRCSSSFGLTPNRNEKC